MSVIDKELWRSIGELLGWVDQMMKFGEVSLHIHTIEGSVEFRWRFKARGKSFGFSMPVLLVEIQQATSIEELGCSIGRRMAIRASEEQR